MTLMSQESADEKNVTYTAKKLSELEFEANTIVDM